MGPYVSMGSIPSELKAFPNWVLWKLLPRLDSEGKQAIDTETGILKFEKRPFQVNGREAKANDPETWTYFEAIKKAFIESYGRYQGIGFVFSENTGLIGIDFGKVRNLETGEWNKEALEEIKALNSYTELSPSGTGAHVIGKGTMPATGRNRNCREMYSSLHYFTITGNVINGLPNTINEISQDIINFYYQKWFPDSKETCCFQPARDKDTVVWCGVKSRSPELLDEEVLSKCRHAANTRKFVKLFEHGDTSSYKSQSEADFALCSVIGYYTQEPEQIDRLFRKSALYRIEWNKKGARTIENALKRLKGSWQPRKAREVA
jgi:putative DNA primase/helicase